MTDTNIIEKNNILTREDRVGRYFKKYLNRYVFAEFAEDFINKSKAGAVMKGVPVPLKRSEVSAFAGGEGVSMITIADNMANVMGCDPYFPHTKDYVAIMNELFDESLCKNLVGRGNEYADDGEYDDACIYFRAVLCIKPDYLDAMYSYARICKTIYENTDNEEVIGRYKAESIDWFELLTEVHPEFSMGHYYLGFAYLNMGLYLKAKLSWETFLKLSRRKAKGKEYEEIEERIQQLQDPINIENGCMKIGTGNFEEGIEILEQYKTTSYRNWWPLHFYLGRGYMQAKDYTQAERAFKTVLILNGSHIDSMRELVAIYQWQGSWPLVKKYTEKIKMIEASQQLDQAEFIKKTQEESRRIENGDVNEK